MTSKDPQPSGQPGWVKGDLDEAASPKLSCPMTYVFPFPVILIFLPL